MTYGSCQSRAMYYTKGFSWKYITPIWHYWVSGLSSSTALSAVPMEWLVQKLSHAHLDTTVYTRTKDVPKQTSRAEGCVMGLDLNATVLINTCSKVWGYEDITMWLTFLNCCLWSHNTRAWSHYWHTDIPELLPVQSQHTCMLSLLTYSSL